MKKSEFALFIYEISDLKITLSVIISTYAVIVNCTQIARALIERGAPANSKKTTNGFTALHQAAIIGEEALAQMLIDKGAQTEITDNEQMTPLHRYGIRNFVVHKFCKIRSCAVVYLRIFNQ